MQSTCNVLIPTTAIKNMGGWKFFVPYFNKLPYTLRSQGDMGEIHQGWNSAIVGNRSCTKPAQEINLLQFFVGKLPRPNQKMKWSCYKETTPFWCHATFSEPHWTILILFCVLFVQWSVFPMVHFSSHSRSISSLGSFSIACSLNIKAQSHFKQVTFRTIMFHCYDTIVA